MSAPRKTAGTRAPARGVLFMAAVLALCLAAWIWTARRPGPPGAGAPATPAFTRLEPDALVYPRYAGSANCRECHAEAYQSWMRSHHGLAERSYQPELDRQAFDPARSFLHGTQTTAVGLDNSKPVVTTRGENGATRPHAVERVIGEHPIRQFLVAGPGGRLQALETAHDPRTNDWFNVFGNEDRQPGEWGHWTGRGMNWNSMCASCHNTRLRKNYNPDTDAYSTRSAETGVGCESCHGPMRAHAEWRRSNPDGKADPTVRSLGRGLAMETCAGCHARRVELTGDPVPGEKFLDHFSLTLPDESEVFHADGQVREENYEYAAFHGSRMHAAGVTCMDCHPPHSAKLLLPGDALCLRCHSGAPVPEFPRAPAINPLAHTFHLPQSEGSRCVNCHMPQTVYMQRHRRHDHGFTVPDPVLTRDHGIPNACNRCHTDRDIAWSMAAVDRWYGERMNRPSRVRAGTVARARRGDEAARPALIEMLDGDPNPYWRAVGAGLLRGWVNDPGVRARLLASLTVTNALVRTSAAQALEPAADSGDPAVAAALRVAWDDPVRSVRVAAAWALRREVSMDSPAGADLQRSLGEVADQPAGLLQAGVLALDRGDPGTAIARMSRAVEWDPNSAPLRHELGIVLSQQGRAREALVQMEAAVRLAPNDAEFQFKLALAHNEVGDLAEAMRRFERAVQLDPQHARAWYNLGLARHQTGQSEAAIEALSRAESASPRDPRIPYARATIHAQLGQRDAARGAARRALELDPAHASAAELLQRLPR